MDTKTKAAIALLKKQGILKKNFKIPQPKTKSDKAIMFGSTVFPVAKEMIRAKTKKLVQDLKKVGQFKRFKLVERYCIFDLNAFRAMFEVGYNPKKVVIRKRKYKKS